VTRIGALVLVIAACASIGGCGYHAGPLTSASYRTVAVSVFGNDTFRREIERELTRSVLQELQARASIRIVADPAAADVHVIGRIVRFDERVLLETKNNLVVESSVVASVSVTYRFSSGAEPRTRTFDATEPYATSTGQSLESATSELFENLAESIVYALDDGWSDSTGRENS